MLRLNMRSSITYSTAYFVAAVTSMQRNCSISAPWRCNVQYEDRTGKQKTEISNCYTMSNYTYMCIYKGAAHSEMRTCQYNHYAFLLL
jgi:hypothetical protein